MFKKIFKMFKGKEPSEREKGKKPAEDLKSKKDEKTADKEKVSSYAKASADKQGGGKEKEKDSKEDKSSSAEASEDKKEKHEIKSDTAHRIFLKPLVSEKTAQLGSGDIYAFVVSRDTNKIEIKRSFFEMYNIKPISVRIINMPQRRKRFGKNFGTQSAWKKAYVRVPKGSNISIYEGV
jgi:large subunit ribosomal protein L23|tara:strand:+ start:83 stop:619 length:537 start_codon:yes stop_codon:yes gene_type:complete